MGLFDLIEQNDRVRVAADRFGQLAALLIADISRRRSDQSGHRVLLHVLAHVDAHHVVLVVEQGLCQGLGQLGLADAGRAEEQEGTDRPVRVGDAGARAQDGLADQAYRLVLPDHVLVQDVLHVQQLLPLALHDSGDRDAGPLADHLGNLLLGDLVAQQVGLLCLLGQLLLLFQFGFELRQLAVFELRCLVQVIFALGALDLAADLLDLLAQLLHLGDGGLLVVPLGLHRVKLLAQLGKLFGNRFQPLSGEFVLLLFQRRLGNLLLDDLAV